MNYRDFEMARKKYRTEQAHKAIHRKQMERPLCRPRAKINILAPNNPQMQGI
tara:strand:+ start:2697 stop:2852 length:156 start_codon:yes stop_codon:yes gene_type:complete